MMCLQHVQRNKKKMDTDTATNLKYFIASQRLGNRQWVVKDLKVSEVVARGDWRGLKVVEVEEENDKLFSEIVITSFP